MFVIVKQSDIGREKDVFIEGNYLHVDEVKLSNGRADEDGNEIVNWMWHPVHLLLIPDVEEIIKKWIINSFEVSPK